MADLLGQPIRWWWRPAEWRHPAQRTALLGRRAFVPCGSGLAGVPVGPRRSHPPATAGRRTRLRRDPRTADRSPDAALRGGRRRHHRRRALPRRRREAEAGAGPPHRPAGRCPCGGPGYRGDRRCDRRGAAGRSPRPTRSWWARARAGSPAHPARSCGPPGGRGTQAAIGFEVDPDREHEVFTIGDGEATKSLATVEDLCRAGRAGASRGPTRWSPWVAGWSPTLPASPRPSTTGGWGSCTFPPPFSAWSTPLSGGKTGVNLPEGKNVGAFWQPTAVLCDTEALATLPSASAARASARWPSTTSSPARTCRRSRWCASPRASASRRLWWRRTSVSDPGAPAGGRSSTTGTRWPMRWRRPGATTCATARPWPSAWSTLRSWRRRWAASMVPGW